jgi:hypothetical protein
MGHHGWHIAQINIGILRAPLESPQIAGFVSELEPVNALADRAPGFVWRLQTEDGDATAIRPFDDDRIMVPAGVVPTVDEAKRRLDLLERLGPTADAFTFREPFGPPGSDARVELDERWACPTG